MSNYFLPTFHSKKRLTSMFKSYLRIKNYIDDLSKGSFRDMLTVTIAKSFILFDNMRNIFLGKP